MYYNSLMIGIRLLAYIIIANTKTSNDYSFRTDPILVFSPSIRFAQKGLRFRVSVRILGLLESSRGLGRTLQAEVKAC